MPAPGDPAFADARGALGRFASPALPLDGLLALHLALPGLHAMYGQGELLVVHATGLPYHERSHFDAQQVLESGGERPFAHDTGWLGRALAGSRHTGMAFQAAVPLVLRGHAGIDTWAPSARPDPSADLVARLERLYADDAPLASALARAQALRGAGGVPAPGAEAALGASMAGGMAGGVTGGVMAGVTAGVTGSTAAPAANRAYPARLAALSRQAAAFLAQPDGPMAAVLEIGGWDSHANQAADNGPLVNNLRALDASLGALRDRLTAPGDGDVGAALLCWWSPSLAAPWPSTAPRAPTTAAVVRRWCWAARCTAGG